MIRFTSDKNPDDVTDLTLGFDGSVHVHETLSFEKAGVSGIVTYSWSIPGDVAVILARAILRAQGIEVPA